MPARLQQRIRRLIAIYLLTCWGAAWATLAAAGPDLLTLPWAHAVVGVFVSWVGSLPGTLGRKLASQYDGKPFHSAQEFARDGAVSIVIGLGGYWAGMYQQMSASLLALSLLLGGYGGTKTLSVWVARMFPPREPAG